MITFEFIFFGFLSNFNRMKPAQSLEQKKIADWSAKMSRIEQAGRKKDEMNKDFANQAKEALDAKMGNYEEKRGAIMSDLKEKLKVRSYAKLLSRSIESNDLRFLFSRLRLNSKRSRRLASLWNNKSNKNAWQ